ncbi:LysR family transcriptional regulator [Pacificitalea manganoxidans]|uniref:LysR family transcriptional regulator n=2 Tax=Pacificitalea manganoxidans TaxID=1411902 RepID=A0A291LXE8_9RHOB|nr:LysR family transcriptional regulator [Pacificitalea manganoxidans]MAQ44637.1 LysR family transcriptional regulator [Actibacterium sp.]MBF54432.1 LysR family transcriptional regulator [Actibacterium sp.]
MEIFTAMMRSATTVQAAEQLGISQPAVSAGLRQLETQLGLTLFERTGRRLRPTAEAHDLFGEIHPMFGLIRSFSTRARDLREGRVGRLRVMSTPPLGYSVVPPALRRFLNERPDVTISFDVRRLEPVVDAVQTGQVDAGLVLNAERLDTVNVSVLQRTQMVVLVPADDALAQEDLITPVQIAERDLVGIDIGSQLGRLVARGFELSAAPYRPRIEVRYSQTAAELVTQGLGVAVVDPYSAAPYLARGGVVARPFFPVSEVRASVITRKGVPHVGLLTRFMADLARSMEENPQAPRL